MTTNLNHNKQFHRLSTTIHVEQYAFKNKLLEGVSIFCRKLFPWILVTLLVFGIAAGFSYGGIIVLVNSHQEKEYADSFDIKGTCLVIDTYQTTRYEDSSTVLKCKVEIYNISHCNDEFNSNDIFDIECADFEAKTNDIMVCYTNNQCDDIFSQKTNYHHDNVGSTEFWGIILCVVSGACIIAYSLFVSKFCECGYWHRSWSKISTYEQYKNYCWSIYAVCCFTKAKRKYHYNIWNYELDESQQFDYYISYHCRLYEIYLGHNLHDLMFSYYENSNGYITEHHYVDTYSE
eukprot:345235_1